MLDRLQKLGRDGLDIAASFGRAGIVLWHSLWGAPDWREGPALLARQRYSSGLADFQAVLETLRSQLNTQDGVAAAYADLSADHVRLYKALGGGWQPETVDTAQAPLDATSPRPGT